MRETGREDSSEDHAVARESWDDAFAHEVESTSRSYRGLGRATGIGESSIRGWASERKWSRAGAIRLATYLGLARNERDFDARFEFVEAQRNRRTEQLYPLSRPDGLDTAARLGAIWRELGAGDVAAHLFVDRFPLELLGAAPREIEELVDAAFRGARFAYLFPSDECAKRLDAALLSVIRASAVTPRTDELNTRAREAGVASEGMEVFRPIPCDPGAFLTPRRSYLLVREGDSLRGLEIRWGELGDPEGVCVELSECECLDLLRVIERSSSRGRDFFAQSGLARRAS